MEKIVGGVLALAAFVAVLVVGIARDLGIWSTVWRGAVAGALGYLLGWLMFGRVGLELAKESAGETVPTGPAPPGKPPEPPAPAK